MRGIWEYGDVLLEHRSIEIFEGEDFVGPRWKRQRGRQATKLEREELTGDRRKGLASIDTLKAGGDITVRCPPERP
jgi:hypothetical protein